MSPEGTTVPGELSHCPVPFGSILHVDSIFLIQSSLIPVFEFGGIESPLIVTPVLSDENYLGYSYWNMSKSHLKIDVEKLSNIRIKNKKHTGKYK